MAATPIEVRVITTATEVALRNFRLAHAKRCHRPGSPPHRQKEGYSITVLQLGLQALLRFVVAIQATGRTLTETTMELDVSRLLKDTPNWSFKPNPRRSISSQRRRSISISIRPTHCGST